MAVTVNYSRLERLLHRIAFAAPSVQLAAAELEEGMFASAAAEPGPPIFITSLPRAGTTLMLEVLSHFPLLASHTYRDMPFVMAPRLWARLSGSFQRAAQPQARAHGDGMLVGFDHPEAFEEIFWRLFWPQHYTSDRITMWTVADDDDAARQFLLRHMRSVIALRRPQLAGGGRYVSKNNNNLARLEFIRRWFPDAAIVVPIREPLAQAESLLRQHRHFGGVHREQPFVRRYMADIGHFEFGALHRPIEFPGLAARLSGRDPDGVDYWLAYWLAAYDSVWQQRASLLPVGYEALCAAGGERFAALAVQLGIDVTETVTVLGPQFRAPRQTATREADCDAMLLDEARELYGRLTAAA